MNLRELSEILELSQTTVSRALNGYPEVSEATRRRVVEMARRVNYIPNPRARGLATGRTMTIGHVIPITTKHEMVNPIFADFIAGAGESYAEAGYEMQLSIISDEREEEIYRAMAERRSVDGVIVHGPMIDDDRISLLSELGLPFVSHGRAGGTTDGYSWMDVNNRGAFRRATDFLLDLGHRRIGLINGQERMNFAARRRLGYEQALIQRDLDLDPELVTSDEMTEHYGYGAARRLLALEVPPTAILVSSILPAIGARRVLSDLGLELGRDVSIAIHDDALSYLQNGGDIPLFTSTRSSVRAAGRECANMLLRLIGDTETGPLQTLWEAELVVGSSTGPAPNQKDQRHELLAK